MGILYNRTDCRLDWKSNAEEVLLLVRALSPYPGAWFLTKKNKRVKVLDAKISITDNNFKPGEVTGGLIVGCKNNAIEILSVQPEGKKIMDIEDYLRGNPISVGEILE